MTNTVNIELEFSNDRFDDFFKPVVSCGFLGGGLTFGSSLVCWPKGSFNNYVDKTLEEVCRYLLT